MFHLVPVVLRGLVAALEPRGFWGARPRVSGPSRGWWGGGACRPRLSPSSPRPLLLSALCCPLPRPLLSVPRGARGLPLRAAVAGGLASLWVGGGTDLGVLVKREGGGLSGCAPGVLGVRERRGSVSGACSAPLCAFTLAAPPRSVGLWRCPGGFRVRWAGLGTPV